MEVEVARRLGERKGLDQLVLGRGGPRGLSIGTGSEPSPGVVPEGGCWVEGCVYAEPR